METIYYNKIIYDAIEMSIIRGKKVGSSDITSLYTDGIEQKDVKTIVVVPAELVHIDTPVNTIYTGLEQKPEPDVFASVDGNNVKLVKDIDYTLSYKNNVDAGTATVIAEGIGNFTGRISSNWIINNVDMEIDAPSQTYVYDGTSQGVGITVSNVVNQTAVIKYGIENGKYEYDIPVQIIHVSESKLIYYQVSAPNHNTVQGSYRLEMTPRTANLVWGELSWIYNGQPHKTTCIVDNLIGNDICTVILEGNEITDIGSKTVRAISLTNADYQLPLTNIEQTLVIKGGLFIKENGVWIPVKDVYKKTSSGWTRVPYEELKVELAKNSGKFVRKTT